MSVGWMAGGGGGGRGNHRIIHGWSPYNHRPSNAYKGGTGGGGGGARRKTKKGIGGVGKITQ